MSNVTDFLSALAILVGAIVLIGGSLALVRGSYNKARIQALREDVGDYDRRLKACEDQLHEAQLREESLQLEVDHVKSENELLKTMVTQRANVDEVLALLGSHHDAAMAGQKRLTDAINNLAAEKKT